MLTESKAEETIVYNTEPATVAEACLKVLREIGKITEESRQTGTIAGKLSVNIYANPVYINLRISKKGETTELHIQTQRKEGLLTSGGAQKGLSSFLEKLGQEKNLSGASTAGW
jgi:hypothetical protein